MTEKRFTIENIGNMFRVLDNTEPITTEFENWDKNDIKNLVELLNNLNDENKQLKADKQKVFDLIDKTIEEETQIAENIEEIRKTRPYVRAVNRIAIKILENLKWKLQND